MTNAGKIEEATEKDDMSDEEFLSRLRDMGFREVPKDAEYIALGTRTFSLKLNNEPTKKRRRTALKQSEGTQ